MTAPTPEDVQAMVAKLRLRAGYNKRKPTHVMYMNYGDQLMCEAAALLERLSATPTQNNDGIMRALNGVQDRWTKLIESQGWGDQFDGDIDTLREAASTLAILPIRDAASPITPTQPEFCPHCGAGVGSFRRPGEGTCHRCDPAPADALLAAAKIADWEQVVRNGGPPCFHIDDGRFCLRARRWGGHGSMHKFTTLDAAIAATRGEG